MIGTKKFTQIYNFVLMTIDDSNVGTKTHYFKTRYQIQITKFKLPNLDLIKKPSKTEKENLNKEICHNPEFLPHKVPYRR